MAIKAIDVSNSQGGNNANKDLSQPTKSNNDAAERQREYERIQAERARLARINDLKEQIALLEKEIAKLRQEITAYKTLKAQVGEAIGKLNSAKGNISNAKTQLAGAYASTAAKVGETQMENEIGQIATNIGTLSGVIIPAADQKIQEKQRLVINKQVKLNQLNDELASL